ncbi:hypothetical protein [Maribacter cobaltidurans]|nr:hypothetical protein [Maribacter cobaltidurans]
MFLRISSIKIIISYRESGVDNQYIVFIYGKTNPEGTIQWIALNLPSGR